MSYSKILREKNKKSKLLKYLNKKEIKEIDEYWKPDKFFFIKLYIKKILQKICKLLNINYYPNKFRKIENVLKKYDKISGGYIDRYENKKHSYIGYWLNGKISKIHGLPIYQVASFLNLFIKKNKLKSFIDIGAGELTTVHALFEELKKYKILNSAAIDLSFKRLEVGKNFLYKKKYKLNLISRSNAQYLPFKDNSFDLVFTSYCLEQAPHIFNEILDELIRVSNKYIILIEPSYEYGSDFSKNKILIKDYPIIKKESFQNKNCNIIYRAPMPLSKYINRSEIVILKKNQTIKDEEIKKIDFVCPITKENLIKKNTFFYAKKNKIKYPIKKGIPHLADFDAIYYK